MIRALAGSAGPFRWGIDLRRRRRSRSRFGGGGPSINPLFLAGGGAALFLGLFVFFMAQADQRAPEPTLMRIELPDAFK